MHLVRVTIADIDGQPATYDVATAMGEAKAVALAAAAHVEHGRRIYRVETEDRGELGSDPDGTYSLEGVDLTDRMEW